MCPMGNGSGIHAKLNLNLESGVWSWGFLGLTEEKLAMSGDGSFGVWEYYPERHSHKPGSEGLDLGFGERCRVNIDTSECAHAINKRMFRGRLRVERG